MFCGLTLSVLENVPCALEKNVYFAADKRDVSYLFVRLFGLLLLLFSCQVMSDSLKPHRLQRAKPPCPPPSPRVCLSSCTLHQWCHSTISSSVILFSFCLQSFSASGSFPVSHLFISSGQSFDASASASVLPMNIQGWFPLRLTRLISLLSEGLSRVFSSTRVWKHLFFGLWYCSNLFHYWFSGCSIRLLRVGFYSSQLLLYWYLFLLLVVNICFADLDGVSCINIYHC